MKSLLKTVSDIIHVNKENIFNIKKEDYFLTKINEFFFCNNNDNVVEIGIILSDRTTEIIMYSFDDIYFYDYYDEFHIFKCEDPERAIAVAEAFCLKNFDFNFDIDFYYVCSKENETEDCDGKEKYLYPRSRYFLKNGHICIESSNVFLKSENFNQFVMNVSNVKGVNSNNDYHFSFAFNIDTLKAFSGFTKDNLSNHCYYLTVNKTVHFFENDSIITNYESVKRHKYFPREKRFIFAKKEKIYQHLNKEMEGFLENNKINAIKMFQVPKYRKYLDLFELNHGS